MNIISRTARTTGLILAAFIMGATVTSYPPTTHVSTVIASVTPVKFMTYNVCVTEPWCTQASPYSLSTRKTSIYGRIKASKPDVLAVQEGSGLFNGVTNMAYDSNDHPAPVFSASKIDGSAGSTSKYFNSTNTSVNYRVGFHAAGSYSGIGLYVNPANVGFTQPIDIRVQQIGTDPTGRQTPRYTTFVHLYDKRTLTEFWVGTAHLTDGSGPAESAERQSQMSAINTLSANLTGSVMLLGDFNSYRTTTSDPIVAGWDDSMDTAPVVDNRKYNSYRDWSSSPRTSTAPLGQHIDRVLTKGVCSVSRWAIQSPTSPKASDHLPLVVLATLPITN